MKKDNDYIAFYVLITFWVMIGGLAQCESARHLDDIRQELSGIRHELFMMRHK